MVVREFNGSGDDLVCSIGALSDMVYGTISFIFKRTSDSGPRNILALHTSGGAGRLSVGYEGASLNWFTGSAYDAFSGSSLTAGVWYTAVIRKPVTTSVARFSYVDMATGVFSHGNGDSNLGNGTAPGVGGNIKFNFEDLNEFASIRIAMRAAWSNSLPWSADTIGDAAIESAGLHTAVSNWVDSEPSSLWKFNQASVDTEVTDETGNGADQESITGTTAVEGDDPPGFNFEEGSPVFEPTLLGDGSLADQIMAGLIDQEFLEGSLADREYRRLLAKLELDVSDGLSIQDLYGLAEEPNRLAGLSVSA